MRFASQAGVAVTLMMVTLGLQCAGMALLIHWVGVWIARGMKVPGHWQSTCS